MNETEIHEKPTRLLWLVPIFMGLLGILMYIAVKDQNQEKSSLLVFFLVTKNEITFFHTNSYIIIFILLPKSVLPI